MPSLNIPHHQPRQILRRQIHAYVLLHLRLRRLMPAPHYLYNLYNRLPLTLLRSTHDNAPILNSCYVQETSFSFPTTNFLNHLFRIVSRLYALDHLHCRAHNKISLSYLSTFFLRFVNRKYYILGNHQVETTFHTG